MSNSRRLPGEPPVPRGVGAGADEEARQREAMQDLADSLNQWVEFYHHVRPVAVTTRVRITDAAVGGKMIPHVELTLALPTGPVVVWLPPTVAKTLGVQLEQAATGASTGLDPFARRLELPSHG